MTNTHKFVAEHGVEKAKEVLEGAPPSATHFNQNSLGGHYAREGVLKMKPQWTWFNTINKEWYYDFTENNHFELSELKQVVESIELVKSYGGIINTRMDIRYLDIDWDYDSLRRIRLKQAITDYELVESYKENQHV